MSRQKMSELSEREMLLILIEKVDRLETEVAQGRVNAEAITKLEMRLIKQEVQFKIWGAVLGFIAGLAGSVILKLLKL